MLRLGLSLPHGIVACAEALEDWSGLDICEDLNPSLRHCEVFLGTAQLVIGAPHTGQGNVTSMLLLVAGSGFRVSLEHLDASFAAEIKGLVSV